MFNKEAKEKINNVLLKAANNDEEALDMIANALSDTLKNSCNYIDDGLGFGQYKHNSIEIGRKYLKDCRWDIVGRAMEVLEEQFKDVIKNTKVCNLWVRAHNAHENITTIEMGYFYGGI